MTAVWNDECAHCGGELITDDVGLCAQCINAGIEHPDDCGKLVGYRIRTSDRAYQGTVLGTSSGAARAVATELVAVKGADEAKTFRGPSCETEGDGWWSATYFAPEGGSVSVTVTEMRQ